jgi:sigma-70-like protein
VSGLESLPPDQRAVLQLILVQGRGYADLATTLKLDVAAVRERAHAGAAALVPDPDALDDTTRGRVVDYLLGQQDDGERIVTFAELGDSPATCRWAQALRERLAAVTREQLPEVPVAAPVAVGAANGSDRDRTVAAAASPASVAPAAAPPAPPAPPRDAPPDGPQGPRPSRLGGALLIAGAAALAIVLAIVLIGGGGGGGKSPSGTAAQTTAARTQASARTQTSTTPSSRQPSARLIGQALLRATPAGGSALGAALVEQTTAGRRAIAVEVTRLAPNGAQDVYALWLQGAAGSRFLGFVPRRVGSDGTFTVTASIASGIDLHGFANVLVTREGTTTASQPTTPGPTIASGPLRLTG